MTHALVVAILAFAGIVALAVSLTLASAVQLAATALIMGGTGLPVPPPAYIASMTNNYITPFYGAPDATVGVDTPEEFFPVTGFSDLTFDKSVAQGVTNLEAAIAAQTDPSLIILGYSQSTRIATIEKRKLIDTYGGDFAAYPDISFALVANVNKPNGGILERLNFFGTIPFVGITFDGATPTNSPVNPSDPADFAVHTKDVTFVHDGYSDFPVYLNPLSIANAVAGIYYLHGTYPDLNSPDLLYQGSNGDTDYYIIATDIVPILQPLADLGVPRPILLALDEPLRVVIETGYLRNVNPGTPTPLRLIPSVNPITFAVNLVSSIPVGLDDALADVGVGRALGTTPSGPYGVGGPPLPSPPVTTLTAAKVASPPPPGAVREAVVESTETPGATGPATDSSPTPPTTKPKPLRSVARKPVDSDTLAPKGFRPFGDRPLKKVLDALTGHRPTTADSSTADSDPSGGDTTANAGGSANSADSNAA